MEGRVPVKSSEIGSFCGAGIQCNTALDTVRPDMCYTNMETTAPILSPMLFRYILAYRQYLVMRPYWLRDIVPPGQAATSRAPNMPPPLAAAERPRDRKDSAQRSTSVYHP